MELNNFGCIQIQTQSCLIRSTHVTSVPCRPPAFVLFKKSFCFEISSQDVLLIFFNWPQNVLRWSRDGHFFGQVGGRGSFSTNRKPLSSPFQLVSQVSFISISDWNKRKERDKKLKKTGLDWDQIKTSASNASDWPRTELFFSQAKFFGPRKIYCAGC